MTTQNYANAHVRVSNWENDWRSVLWTDPALYLEDNSTLEDKLFHLLREHGIERDICEDSIRKALDSEAEKLAFVYDLDLERCSAYNSFFATKRALECIEDAIDWRKQEYAYEQSLDIRY